VIIAENPPSQSALLVQPASSPTALLLEVLPVAPTIFSLER
jgi:hypothetical protein